MKLTNGANSPLRYPGGKGKITQFIGEVLDKNQISGTYIEPFAGGAGVAINLLLAEKVQNIVINDLDTSVYSFWLAIKNDSEKLIQYIDEVPFDVYDHADALTPTERFDYYLFIQKKLHDYRKKDQRTVLEAFYFFMANRINISGIISAGPIGGRKQDGKYNISSRFNKKELISRIRKITQFSDRITVTNLEASHMIDMYARKIFGSTENTLLFVDPPYYVQGKSLYNYYATDSIHQLTAELLLNNIDKNWILTYDTAPQIFDLYDSDYVKKYRYSIQYSANKRGKFDEFMFASSKLKISSYHNVQLQSIMTT